LDLGDMNPTLTSGRVMGVKNLASLAKLSPTFKTVAPPLLAARNFGQLFDLISAQPQVFYCGSSNSNSVNFHTPGGAIKLLVEQ
jgi:hypothetical protein